MARTTIPAAAASRRPLLPLLLLLTVAAAASTITPATAAPLELDDASLPAFLKKDLTSVALVAFTAPWCGHCKALKPEYRRAADALAGLVPVVDVDADKNRAAASEHNVSGFPTIKLFFKDPRTGEVKSQAYQGERTAKALAAFALDKASSLAFKRLGEKGGGGSSKPSSSGGAGAGAGSCGGGGGGGAGTCGGGGPGAGAGSCGGGGGGGHAHGGNNNGDDFFGRGKNVAALNEASFEDDVRHGQDLWLVLFYAPWCGHCQRAKPEVVAAAEAMQGRVRIGAVDCTKEQALCNARGVRGYPSFFFYAPGQDEEEYQGGRDAASMIEFLSGKHAVLGPAPEVKEVVDAHVVESGCLGDGSLLGGDDEDDKPATSSSSAKKQLCFFAFLPDVLDTGAAGREAYLSSLRKLAEGFKGRPWAFFWSAAGRQPELEGLLTGGAGVVPPLLVAYKPGTGEDGDKSAAGKYSTMRGAFDAGNMKAFVESLRRGREPVAEVASSGGKEGGGLAASIATVEPWDGKDGVPEVEEEFSLDEIMGA
jgi:protein disulfide-isomerase A6